MNVFCAISKNHVHGPFFFEGIVPGDVYLQMLQNWLMDELIANKHKDFIYQQDSAPPHCALISMTICQGDGSGMPVVRTM